MVLLMEATRLLGDMGPRELEILSEYVEAWRIDAGEYLFREGDKGDSLSVVVAGKIEIVKDDGHGKRRSVAVLTTGRALGEMALVDGEPRSATAIMSETGTILVLSLSEFDRLLQDRPVLAFRILMKITRALSQKLRQTTGRLMDLLEPDAEK